MWYDVEPPLLPLRTDALQILLVALQKQNIALRKQQIGKLFSTVFIFTFEMIKMRKFAFVANNIACSYLWMDWKAWEICGIRVFKELLLPHYYELKEFSYFVNNFMAPFHQRSHLRPQCMCRGYFFLLLWMRKIAYC